jgi:4'-phosphopantetheinyl transferase
MVELYASRLVSHETFTKQQEELLALVSERQRKRFFRFRQPEGGQRSILGELLVRHVVGERLQIPNKRIMFDYGEHGKPMLCTFEGMQFSISHSGTWVVGAFSNSTVGVDIQGIEPREPAVANRFFTTEECELISRETEENRLLLFYELWTLKESYLKALGCGMTGSLRSFTMRRDSLGFYAESDGTRLPFFFRQYEFDPGYKLAVCAEEREFAEDVQIVTLDQITATLKEGR